MLIGMDARQKYRLELVKRMEKGDVLAVDIARRTGISTAAVYSYINDTRCPKLDSAEQISLFFGLTLGQMLGGDSAPDRQDSLDALTAAELSQLTEIFTTLTGSDRRIVISIAARLAGS